MTNSLILENVLPHLNYFFSKRLRKRTHTARSSSARKSRLLKPVQRSEHQQNHASNGKQKQESSALSSLSASCHSTSELTTEATKDSIVQHEHAFYSPSAKTPEVLSEVEHSSYSPFVETPGVLSEVALKFKGDVLPLLAPSLGMGTSTFGGVKRRLSKIPIRSSTGVTSSTSRLTSSSRLPFYSGRIPVLLYHHK